MEEERRTLLNKPVRIIKTNNFVIFGTITAENEYGVWVKNLQETSFISFKEILAIRENREEQ